MCVSMNMSYVSQGYGFQASYDGDELSHTVRNLHRSTTYRFRVRTQTHTVMYVCDFLSVSQFLSLLICLFL